MTSQASIVQTTTDMSTSGESGPHSIMDVGKIAESSELKKNIQSLSPNNDEIEMRVVSPDRYSQNSFEVKRGSSTSSGLNAEGLEPTVLKEASFTTKKPPPLEMIQDQAICSGEGPKTPVSPRTKSSASKADRERKLGHRRVGEGGEVTYKKIQSSQIMGSIQLGISHAVGGLASKPERDLLMQDFMTVETTNFYSQGSQQTPAHHYSDFRFKSFAPIAFRYFRDLFGIQPDDFLLSLCNEPLRELTNPGASGSIFYLSADDEFIIKTVQHKEGEFLMKLLLGYYMNLNQNPRTLLPKFFGLYCYQCNSKNVRLVVMNNLLPSSIKLHEKYDLKGSTYKRKASKAERSKASPTFKDLDFLEIHPDGLMLEADTYTALIKTIQRDCRVLESFKIMDYSLLVAVHNLDLAAKEEAERRRNNSTGDQEYGEDGAVAGTSSGAPSTSHPPLARSRSINRQKLVAHSTALESIQAESEPIDEEEDVPPGGIPARNAKGERLLLFLGIIDILQSYRLKKKLEHTLKAMIHDGDTVSVHRPGFYSQRFQNFMATKVFKKVPSPLKHSPSKKKLAARTRTTSIGDGAGLSNAELVAVSQESAADGHGVAISASSPTTPGQHSTHSAFNVVSGTNAGNQAAPGGGTAAGTLGTGGSAPVNLPAVLKDRVPPGSRPGLGSRGPPPPVPPRSPKRVNINAPSPRGVPSNLTKVSFRPDRPRAESSRSIQSVSSSSSTPPPAFDEVLRTESTSEVHRSVSTVSTSRREQSEEITHKSWNSQSGAISYGEDKSGIGETTEVVFTRSRQTVLVTNHQISSTSEVHLVEMRSESKASSMGSGDIGRLRSGGSVPTPTFTEDDLQRNLAASGSPHKTGGSTVDGHKAGLNQVADSTIQQDSEMTHL